MDASAIVALVAILVAPVTPLVTAYLTRREASEARTDERQKREREEARDLLAILTAAEVAYLCWCRIVMRFLRARVDASGSDFDLIQASLDAANDEWRPALEVAEQDLSERLLSLGATLKDPEVWADVETVLKPIREDRTGSYIASGWTQFADPLLDPAGAAMASLRERVKGARGLSLAGTADDGAQSTPAREGRWPRLLRRPRS